MIKIEGRGTLWSSYQVKAKRFRPVPLFLTRSREEPNMQEQWKPVIEYEGFYEVSNLGKVRSVDRILQHGERGKRKWVGKIMKPNLSKKGYYRVMLRNRTDRKIFLVHALVARAFLGPRPLDMVTDHIDGNRENNKLDNLQYITQRENCIKGINSLPQNKTSKYVGVCLIRGRWIAQKTFHGRVYRIGAFPTQRQAHEEYLKADEKYCKQILEKRESEKYITFYKRENRWVFRNPKFESKCFKTKEEALAYKKEIES